MSVPGTRRLTKGSEPGPRARAMAPAEQRGAGRDLAERAKQLRPDVTRAVEVLGTVGRALAGGPGREVARARFREVSLSDSYMCSADFFSSFPHSLYRRAL